MSNQPPQTVEQLVNNIYDYITEKFDEELKISENNGDGRQRGNEQKQRRHPKLPQSCVDAKIQAVKAILPFLVNNAKERIDLTKDFKLPNSPFKQWCAENKSKNGTRFRKIVEFFGVANKTQIGKLLTPFNFEEKIELGKAITNTKLLGLPLETITENKKNKYEIINAALICLCHYFRSNPDLLNHITASKWMTFSDYKKNYLKKIEETDGEEMDSEEKNSEENNSSSSSSSVSSESTTFVIYKKLQTKETKHLGECFITEEKINRIKRYFAYVKRNDDTYWKVGTGTKNVIPTQVTTDEVKDVRCNFLRENVNGDGYQDNDSLKNIKLYIEKTIRFMKLKVKVVVQ